jgi:rRNA maturation endonuclease Nob1
MTGGVVPASMFNELVDAINELQMMKVGPGLSLHRSGAGTTLAVNATEAGCADSSDEVTVITLAEEWDVDDNDNKGAQLAVISRITITVNGVKIFYHNVKCDACGRIFAIGPEVESTICPVAACA